MTIDRVVLVTKKTALEELVERYNAGAQARFYLETGAPGSSFDEFAAAHDCYAAAVAAVQRSLPRGLKQHVIERGFLPNYVFGAGDLVVTVGPDGLVVNTAKYLSRQPILAVNPDPRRFDRILLPFTPNAPAELSRRPPPGP